MTRGDTPEEHAGTIRHVWASMFVDGVGWSAATQFEHDDHTALELDLAVGDANAVAAWTARGTATDHAHVVWVARFTRDFGWSDPQMMQTERDRKTGTGWSPRVAIDPDGATTVAWFHGARRPSSGSGATTRAAVGVRRRRRRSRGPRRTAWSPAA